MDLQWQNIDLQTGEIAIVGQLQRKRGDYKDRALKDTSKAHKSRTIIVPQFVVDILLVEQHK